MQAALPGLALCQQVIETAAGLRAALYARVQALQLLKAPIKCEPVELSLFSTRGAPTALVGSPNAGPSLHTVCMCTQFCMNTL